MAAVSPSKSRRDDSLSPPPLKKRKFESTTTKQTVNNFFKAASQKEPEKVIWRTLHGSLLLGRYQPTAATQGGKREVTQRAKVAAFDLDSTLITTFSGNIFSKDASDWKWWHISVPSTLKALYNDGYTVTILTNQGRIALHPDPKTIKSDTRYLNTFKTKVTSILSHFDFPILLLAATGRDNFRKPRTGMWEEVLSDLDLDDPSTFDLPASFFVGDAGGRPAAATRKADHACSDRDFAANINLKFLTPEEYFLSEPPAPFTRPFEPKDYLSPTATASPPTTTTTDSTPIIFTKKHSLDIVLLVGSPASGKSTFYTTYLKPIGYVRINQDTLKTRDKCVKVATETLSAPNRQSVAIDNTNADPATRAIWVALARTHGVPIRCIYFTAPAKLCEHNDTVRALAGTGISHNDNDNSDHGGGDGIHHRTHFNPDNRAILPYSAFSGFAARFREPSVKEGFEDMVRVDFVFRGRERERGVWARYWI